MTCRFRQLLLAFTPPDYAEQERTDRDNADQYSLDTGRSSE